MHTLAQLSVVGDSSGDESLRYAIIPQGWWDQPRRTYALAASGDSSV